MGHFIDMAAVLKPLAEVEEYFARFPEADGVECVPGLPDRTLVIYGESTGNFERVSRLSAGLNGVAMALHIHDDDLWLYELYAAGVLQDCFNTIPDYWQEIDEEEQRKWQGNAAILAAHWTGLDPASVSRYLVPLADDPPAPGTRAYPDDAFEYGDCWQVTDFLRRLGTPYPG